MVFFRPLLLFLLLSPCAIFAQNESNLSQLPSGTHAVFITALFANGTPASLLPVVLLARSGEKVTVYRDITSPSGNLILSLEGGDYELDALLDFPQTSGIDFASTSSLTVLSNENSTLIFYPAGSLAGKVTKNGLPLPQASVSASCPSSAFDYVRINGKQQVDAGEAGAFLFSVLPAGTCVISSSSGNLAGSSVVEIEHGLTSEASVEMVEKSGQDYLLLAGVAAAAALLLAAGWAFFRFRGKKAKAPPPIPPRANGKKREAHAHLPVRKNPSNLKSTSLPSSQVFDESSPKASAVLSTLSEREREIALFLLKGGGRAKSSAVQHKLLIPKTSVLRNLRSLERKNIVKITPFGRNVLAEIEWNLFR